MNTSTMGTQRRKPTTAQRSFKGATMDDNKTIIMRNIPESIRRELKARAAKEGKSMQGLILELITRYVSAKREE